MKVKLNKNLPWFKKRKGEVLEVLAVYFRPFMSLCESIKVTKIMYVCIFDTFVNEIDSKDCLLVDGTMPKNWIFYQTENLSEFNDGDYDLQIFSIIGYPEAVQNKQHLIRLYKQEKGEFEVFQNKFYDDIGCQDQNLIKSSPLKNNL